MSTEKDQLTLSYRAFCSFSLEQIKAHYYLMLCALGLYQFDIRKFTTAMGYGDHAKTFRVLKSLLVLNSVQIHFEPETHEIFILIYTYAVNLDVENWTLPIVKDFCTEILEDNPSYLNIFVTQIFAPLGKTDDYLKQFIDETEVKPAKPRLKTDAELADAEAYRRRKEVRDKTKDTAQLIVQLFYEKLSQTGHPIYLTAKKKFEEVGVMLEFFKTYPELYDNVDLLKEGIEFFRTDDFWKRQVINIRGYAKHFGRFLENHNMKKTKRGTLKLIT